MPLYEYVCQKCDAEFEMIVSFSATEMPACPNCEAKDVQRKMGLPAIHFKGSGWYINDSKKSKESAVGEGKKEEGSSSSDSEKSSKPEKESSADSKEKANKSSSDAKSESSAKSSGDSDSKAKSNKPKKSEKASK